MEIKTKKNIIIGTSVTVAIALVTTAIVLPIMLSNNNKGGFPGISNSYENLMVIPNSPIEKDGSFNEETILGAGEYALITGSKVGKSTPSKIGVYEEYKKVIDDAYLNGATILISSGFNLTDTLLGKADYSNFIREANGVMFNPEYKDNYYIFIDDSTYEASISRNVISVSFRAEEAGFMAGIAAAIYATWNKSYKVSTFGGQQLATVFDWMSGYEQGVNWFNYWALGYAIDDVDNTPTNPDAILLGTDWANEKVKITSSKKAIDYTKRAQETKTWFTGTFDIGGGTNISNLVIDAGASVIFPVAGAQYGDAISSSKTSNDQQHGDEKKYVKIIGVDADATNTYPNNEREILGSATKDLRGAVKMTLWYTEKFIKEYQQDPSLVPNSGSENDNFEQDSLTKITTLDTEGGWQESNTTKTATDFSTMETAEEIDEAIDANSNKMYVDGYTGTNYYGYGETLDNGALFVGNYANHGIGFVQTANIDSYVTEIFGSEYTFDSIIVEGFSQNEIIEFASNSFADEFTTHITTDNLYPWIPNWTTYIKS